eukprot:COSAG01_NODE_683_length_14253_cov_33.540837_13_plen_108_part_00
MRISAAELAAVLQVVSVVHAYAMATALMQRLMGRSARWVIECVHAGRNRQGRLHAVACDGHSARQRARSLRAGAYVLLIFRRMASATATAANNDNTKDHKNDDDNNR